GGGDLPDLQARLRPRGEGLSARRRRARPVRRRRRRRGRRTAERQRKRQNLPDLRRSVPGWGDFLREGRDRAGFAELKACRAAETSVNVGQTLTLLRHDPAQESTRSP